MHIETMILSNESELIKKYKKHDMNIMKYFDYMPYSTYEKRLADLSERQFNRKDLVKVLQHLNRDWHAPTQTMENIERLKDENSVVVIGGQQAGLLTGPMYTIHKIISILQLAKQQEEKLNIPVIPVFWIAGEDHDYDEINHIYLSDDVRLKKHQLYQPIEGKPSISNIPKDNDQIKKWLDGVLGSLEETLFTKNVSKQLYLALEKSNNYVDFFSHIIFTLFEEEGIVLMDSAHPEIRQLEKSHFTKMIENQETIASTVYETKQELEQAGFPIMMDTELNSGHLFYEYQNERLLLERTEEGYWTDKADMLHLTTEELVQVVQETPERLSNNVVTRPLMQESLFPTLAFVGGNGEIAYWSTLKGAFHCLGMNMPPVIPRLSFTLSNTKVKKTLDKLNLNYEAVLSGETAHKKVNWLKAQTNPPIDLLVHEVQQAIDLNHEPLRALAHQIQADVGQLADANLLRIQREIEFLKQKMSTALESKYAQQIHAFNFVQNVLYPGNHLQERSWNIVEWINQHGSQFISDLCKETYSFEAQHYLIEL